MTTAIPILYWLFVAGIYAAVWTTPEPGPEEVRATIRVTAFTSAVPFLVVFVTSAAHYFLRSAATRWLMANRRYLGLSVAASHFWHLVAIVALIRWYPGGEPIATATIVFGGGGFVLLGLMAATSNDASQRALGRGWGWLHKLGVYVLWIDFIVTYSGTATIARFHAVMTLLFALAWMARVVAFVTARQDARRARLARV
jgi:DMSO/TMAO reductase YedYZ heme-binding membrane subunit